ncbi:MAG: hypothetical protein ACK4F7_01820 [Inhella sp.]
MSMQLHKVLRAIWIGGEPAEPGSTVELVPVLGAELRAAGKVELLEGEGKPLKGGEPRPVVLARIVKAAKPAKPAPAVSAPKTDGPTPTEPPAA